MVLGPHRTKTDIFGKRSAGLNNEEHWSLLDFQLESMVLQLPIYDPDNPSEGHTIINSPPAICTEAHGTVPESFSPLRHQT